MFADNASMQLIKNPSQFDVVLTTNIFGDILTDEASQISGSMGMLPSASIGDGTGFLNRYMVLLMILQDKIKLIH